MALLTLLLGAMFTVPSRQAMGQDNDRVASGSSFAACDPSDSAFVCGLRNAEDLVRLAGTPWVVASHMRSEFGPLEAIRIDTHEVHRLYPTPEATVDWDRKTYPDCPAPPESLSSHGLNVQPLGGKKFRLYAINHGGRESIEIIDVTVRGKRLRTTWRGCIRVPKELGANAIVPLHDHGVALSGGSVATWHPGRGWMRLEGIKDGNGIEVSRDDRWLFVALYEGRSVVRVPVGGGAVQTVSEGDFHPDNLRWGEDDRLYVTGHGLPNDPRWPECRRRKPLVCDAGFVITQIDPATLTTKEIVRSDGIKDAFGAATTALQVGDRFWVGTFWGDRIAILKLQP